MRSSPKSKTLNHRTPRYYGRLAASGGDDAAGGGADDEKGFDAGEGGGEQWQAFFVAENFIAVARASVQYEVCRVSPLTADETTPRILGN